MQLVIMSPGIKAGLLSRLNLQEQTIMQLQSDSLKHELSQQQHKSEVEQLQYQLAERDKEVSALRSELVRREKTVDKQRVELEDAMRHIEELQFAQVCGSTCGFLGREETTVMSISSLLGWNLS